MARPASGILELRANLLGLVARSKPVPCLHDIALAINNAGMTPEQVWKFIKLCTLSSNLKSLDRSECHRLTSINHRA